MILLLLCIRAAFGQTAPKTQEDVRKEAALAAFTQKMRDANYPALFDKAAAEFNVPPDILKGVSFAETRWDHLQWPPGETVSPETGMPRPYGIMSLWDNQYFGQSLIEAANLLGKTLEELKADPFQNMRGGAALLRKIYDETPKPAGSSEAQLESWRNAIRKYCGIPEPDLNARHALDVYTFISQGYHQFGIEWKGQPVDLEPIREETRKIVAEEELKRQARTGGLTNSQGAAIPQLGPAPAKPLGQKESTRFEPASSQPVVISDASPPKRDNPRSNRIIFTALAAIAVLIVGFLLNRKQDRENGQ